MLRIQVATGVHVAMDTGTVTMTTQLLPMHRDMYIGTHTDSG